MSVSGFEREAATVADGSASPLTHAFDRLRGLDLFGKLGLAAVSRVEVGGSGAEPSFVLTLETAAGERWFRATGTGIVELHPEGDPDLPLAASLARATVLSYRPGRRVVLLRERDDAVEKGYRRGRVDAAGRRHELVSKLAGTIPGLVLPRLVERREASASLLLERLGGTPLRLEPASVDRFAALGRALRTFQEAPDGGAALPDHGAADELVILESWAARVRRAMGAVSPEWLRARDQAARVAASLPRGTPVLAHRDLHDGQLKDRGDTVALVDFDLLSRADAALDAGNLLAHFELRRRQRFPGADAATAAAAGRALLAGLGRGDEPGFPSRLAFYCGTSLLRLALVYELRPRWRQLAPALTDEAKICFESIG